MIKIILIMMVVIMFHHSWNDYYYINLVYVNFCILMNTITEYFRISTVEFSMHFTKLIQVTNYCMISSQLPEETVTSPTRFDV